MTFTKLFASITESTIWCEDSDTRIVWITMLAMANKSGCVFASPPGLANRARVSLECVLLSLEKFQKPDKYSRTKEYEGRRIREIDGGWQLLTYTKHRAILDEEDRQRYMREYMREYRGGSPFVNTNVNTVNTGKLGLTQAEAEAEADTEEESRSKSLRTFVRPSLEEVRTYCHERENLVDPEKWFDHYSSNGFKVGRASMRDWKAAIRTWERNGHTNGRENGKTTAQLRNERSAASLRRAFGEVESAANLPGSLFKRPQ